MEIDILEKISGRVVIWLAKSKALAEDLDREGQVSFKDDPATLHQSSYQKDSRNILLQCVNVMGK